MSASPWAFLNIRVVVESFWEYSNHYDGLSWQCLKKDEKQWYAESCLSKLFSCIFWHFLSHSPIFTITLSTAQRFPVIVNVTYQSVNLNLETKTQKSLSICNKCFALHMFTLPWKRTVLSRLPVRLAFVQLQLMTKSNQHFYSNPFINQFKVFFFVIKILEAILGLRGSSSTKRRKIRKCVSLI